MGALTWKHVGAVAATVAGLVTLGCLGGPDYTETVRVGLGTVVGVLSYHLSQRGQK